MIDWQTIESAPKDGTQFLAYDPSLEVGMCNGIVLCIAIGAEWAVISGSTNITGSNGYGMWSHSPTHWQPLPPPPKK